MTPEGFYIKLGFSVNYSPFFLIRPKFNEGPILQEQVSWALLAGEFESAATPIKIKNHGRAEKSIFRLGFETLRNCLLPDSNELRTKAAISTTYVTFVLYLDTEIKS